MNEMTQAATNSHATTAGGRASLSYARAVQIMLQNTGGSVAKDGLPSIYIDQNRRCFVYRENVIQAMQMAATFAWDIVVMPGTSLHKNYELLLALTRGEATPQEQLEAAVLIRGLLGDE